MPARVALSTIGLATLYIVLFSPVSESCCCDEVGGYCVGPDYCNIWGCNCGTLTPFSRSCYLCVPFLKPIPTHVYCRNFALTRKQQTMVGSGKIEKKYSEMPHLTNLLNVPAFHRFSQIDTDGDGHISIAETGKFAMLHPGTTSSHVNSTLGIADGFRKADTNSDGFIQPDEFDGDLKALLMVPRHSSNIKLGSSI